MTSITSFVGTYPRDIDREINHFLDEYKQYHRYAKVIDIKVTAVVRPAGNEKLPAETLYIYVVILDDRGGHVMDKLKSCPFEEPTGEYEITTKQKKQTRFDVITKSPEVLADVLNNYDFCEGASCDGCYLQSANCSEMPNKDVWLHWLKEEV